MPAEIHAPAGTEGGPSRAQRLSEIRTRLAFTRTQIAADRTLMASVRTSLSMIGFGFTVNTALGKLDKANVMEDPDHLGRTLGLAVLSVGVLLLALAIVSHTRFGLELIKRRRRLSTMGLLDRTLPFRISPSFVTASLVLLAGLGALTVVVVRSVR